MSERMVSMADVVRLMGERVAILHEPDGADSELSGRDVDCAVHGLDPWWPLRLGDGWRLCQKIHYDLRGWYWVVEREGSFVALDTIDDPRGFGRDGINTEIVVRGGVHPSPSTRAAYLTVKRLRKRSRDPREWSRIRDLAREDPREFDRQLRTMAGPSIAAIVGPAAIAGTPPDRRSFDRLRFLRQLRRFGRPDRAVAALGFAAQRYLQRLSRPTGFTVVLCGSDGTGKSTLANRLPGLLRDVFRGERHVHWRPEVLPRPGRLLGRAVSDPTAPHARSPYPPAVSAALLLYYWLDFFLAGNALGTMSRARATLLIVERGWWDVGVDPRRYRLDVPTWLVRVLGVFINRPDLAIVLEAPSELVGERKSELPSAELTRQSIAWRSAFPSDVQVSFVDASKSSEDVAQEVRELILTRLERRTTADLAQGWWSPPGRRWWLPRGPRSVATAGVNIFQPVTTIGLAGWRAAASVAWAGGFRLTFRGSAPPRAVRRLLAPHVPAGGTLAVSRANHPGRYVGLIIGRDGLCSAVAKVATDDTGRHRLEREAESIRTMGSTLPEPLRPPTILAHEPGVLVLGFVRWRPRREPWRLEPEVARALGTFFGCAEGAGASGPSHGDVAPWNLLRTPTGWTLIDWESARSDAPPFHDVAHHIVQTYALLGKPVRDEIVRGVRDGTGWIGDAVRAYADAARLDPEAAESSFIGYLRQTRATLDPRSANERRGVVRRDALLHALEER